MSTASGRRLALQEALSAQKIDMRPDSALCKSFIEGTLDRSYTLDTVVYLCGLHRYLYDYTNYSERCAMILPRIASVLTSSLGGYEAAWAYCVRNEAPLIKAEVLQEVGVPEVWPWMIEEGKEKGCDVDNVEQMQKSSHELRT